MPNESQTPLPSPTRPSRGSEVERGEDAGCEEAQRSGDLSVEGKQGILDERKKEEKSTDKDAEGDDCLKGSSEEHRGCDG